MGSGLTLPLPVVRDASDPRACQVLLDAVADGVPIRMLLDTGTDRSSVPHLEAPSDRLQRNVRSGTGNGVFSSGKHDETLVQLDVLEWGSLTARDLTVSMDAPGWPHPPLLGMDVLGSHACHFRFGAGVLELDGEAPSDPLLPLPTPSDKAPAVPVQWEGTTIEAVWDTGAGITVVDRTWGEAHPEIVKTTDEFGTGTDVHGTTSRNLMGRLAPCRIGHATFPEQDCGVLDLSGLGIDMILGLPLISHADWYLDFPQRRWSNKNQ
jgi:hypothetical protein